MGESNDTCLHLKGISKYFPGVVALDCVDFELRKGEVHALCGENGAGKSTLMNILSGNHQPDTGEIMLNGLPTKLTDQLSAQEKGISIVYQERSLVIDLSVAENIYAGNQPVDGWGFIDYSALYAQARTLLKDLGMPDIDPKTRLGDLASGKQQMVEIAKALAQHPNILILDEPTASISETDANVLFGIMKSLTSKGVAIIYISHRMAEIFEVADRVTVLKDGKYQGTNEVSDITIDRIIRMMVGRELETRTYKSNVTTDTILQVNDLCGDRFQNISFTLKKGEILGLAGLVGAGRTELARAVFGADPYYQGTIFFEGEPFIVKHPADAIKQGLVYLPENRKTQGVFLDMTVEENLLATNLKSGLKNGLFSTQKQRSLAEDYIEKMNIKTPSSDQTVMNLSGGNQQKIVFAKWLMTCPKVLIIDEPTHGIDVGSKSEIYDILKELTSLGTSILLISSELPELMALSDRMLVLCNGKVTARLTKNEYAEEEIMHFASGTKRMNETVTLV